MLVVPLVLIGWEQSVINTHVAHAYNSLTTMNFKTKTYFLLAKATKGHKFPHYNFILRSSDTRSAMQPAWLL